MHINNSVIKFYFVLTTSNNTDQRGSDNAQKIATPDRCVEVNYH